MRKRGKHVLGQRYTECGIKLSLLYCFVERKAVRKKEKERKLADATTLDTQRPAGGQMKFREQKRVEVKKKVYTRFLRK